MSNALGELFQEIADAIRSKTGGTDKMAPADFPENIDSIGVDLPTLTNPGDADDLLKGIELIDQSGKIVTGTMGSAVYSPMNISVDTSGKITAKQTVSSGYTDTVTKTGTLQLTTQSAQTITPSTEDQTIESGRYITGTQTIEGDSNLVAKNIKSGISIFGVAGSFEGSSSSGGLAVQTGTITGTGEAIDIDTGLSSVEYFAIYRDTFASKGLVEAVYRGDTGYTHYVYCTSYTSYAKTCLLSFDNSIGTVREGTFTWSSNNTSTGLTSDVVYNWIAFGTE